MKHDGGGSNWDEARRRRKMQQLIAEGEAGMETQTCTTRECRLAILVNEICGKKKKGRAMCRHLTHDHGRPGFCPREKKKQLKLKTYHFT